MAEIVPGHPCTAWCDHDKGLHVDLAHWTDGAWSEAEVRAAWAGDGARVVRIERATEAPDAEPTTPGGPSRQAHLVWWRLL